MKSAIDILDIKPSKEGMPKEYNWLDQKYVKLPDVTGLTLEEAKKILKQFKLVYSGTGEKVTYQSPEGDMFIKENGTVVLMLN